MTDTAATLIARIAKNATNQSDYNGRVAVAIANDAAALAALTAVPTPPVETFTESAEATAVPPAASITDSTGVVWTVTAGAQIAKNGTVDPVTNSVTQLVYHNHVVYQQNTSSDWYAWQGSAWGPASKTAPIATAPAATTAASTTASGTSKVLLGFYGGPGSSGAAQGFTLNNSFQDSGLGKTVEIIAGQPVIVSLDLGAEHYNATPADYQAAAAGQYDQSFQATVQSLVPMASQILGVRIDPEFNLHGQGSPWQTAYTVVGPATYIAAWNALAKFVRKLLPNAKLIWNPNIQNGADVTPYFPGKPTATGGADIIGIDAYMQPQWNTTFSAYKGGTNGLDAFSALSKANGNLPLMMCEWADLFADASNLTAMAAWINANCVAAAYWNSTDALSVGSPNSSPILTGAKAAAFSAAFGAGSYGGSLWTKS